MQRHLGSFASKAGEKSGLSSQPFVDPGSRLCNRHISFGLYFLILELSLVSLPPNVFAETLGIPGVVSDKILLSISEDSSEPTPDEGRPDCYAINDILNAARTLTLDAKHIYGSPARLNTRKALWVGGILTVGGVIYAYDQEIYDAFHRSKNHKVYKHVRDLGESIEPVGHMGKTNRYYFGALVFGYIFRIKLIKSIAAEILESHFIAGGVKNALNIAVGRRRPHQDRGPRSFEFNDGTSFPSGHSSNALQLATILSHHVDFLAFKVLAYSLATSICFERITSDGHWPSDVYFAAVLGTVVSTEILNLNDERKAKLEPIISEQGKGLGLRFSCRF